MSWVKLRHQALTRGKLADLELLRRSLSGMGRQFVVFTAESPRAAALSDRLRVVDRA